MALILNIETSTNTCSVALAKDGLLYNNGLIESTEEKTHASILAVFIKNVLENNNLQISDLDAISVSKGPGSYTGLRIGVSTAKGLAYGLEKPLIAINTLQAMAYGQNSKLDDTEKTDKNMWFCPMIDARRMEVYSAFYNTDIQQTMPIAANIIDEKSFLNIINERKVMFFGNGAPKCAEILKNSKSTYFLDYQNSAKDMIKLSETAYNNKDFVDVAYFEPFYLKDFVATTPKKKVI